MSNERRCADCFHRKASALTYEYEKAIILCAKNEDASKWEWHPYDDCCEDCDPMPPLRYALYADEKKIEERGEFETD